VGVGPTGWAASVSRVLLLNATFEALQLVSERRAVVLMLAGRASRSSRRVPERLSLGVGRVEIPAIVRLHDMVSYPPKWRTPPLTRRSLLLRDSYRCAYCLEHADTIDHVFRASRGGRHEWTKRGGGLPESQHAKGDRLLEEIGWRMHFEPRVRRAVVAVGGTCRPRPVVGRRTSLGRRERTAHRALRLRRIAHRTDATFYVVHPSGPRSCWAALSRRTF